MAGKHQLVHRLVAFAHLRLPPSSMHINVLHLDGDVTNNHKSNLRYATPKECSAIGAHSGERPNACKPVLSRALGELTWALHPSATAAAKATGVTPAAVRTCCFRGRPMRSGLEFKHAQHENLVGEQWTPAVHPLTGTLLPGTLVSSMGRVLNSKGICTSGSLTPAGYCAVQINDKMHFVHRLVLCSFAKSLPSSSWVANHVDGNKQNNSLENLEPVTHAENALHAVRTNLRKPPFRPVLGRPLGSTEWTRFDSRKAAATHLSCSVGAISHVCSGRLARVKGWEFQSDLCASALPGEEWAPVVLPPLVP